MLSVGLAGERRQRPDSKLGEVNKIFSSVAGLDSVLRLSVKQLWKDVPFFTVILLTIDTLNKM